MAIKTFVFHGILPTLLLISAPVMSDIEISRVGSGASAILPYLLDSYDLFSNPGDLNYCGKKLSYCIGKSCKFCRCNYNLSFHSLAKGCVSSEKLNALPPPISGLQVGEGCEFSFYYFASNRIPLWKIKRSNFGFNSGRIGNYLSTFRSINLNKNSVKCSAREIYKVDKDGNTLIDSNKNQMSFSIENYIYQRSGVLYFIKNLVMNTLTASLEKKLAGHLIRLEVECIDKSDNSSTLSCILFKMNGTYIDKTTVTTDKPLAPSTNGKGSTPRPATASTLTATLAALDTKKPGSTPIGAIIGGVVGLLVILLLIAAVFIYTRRKKKRESPKRSSSMTGEKMLEKDRNLNVSYKPGGAAPSFSLAQSQNGNEDATTREATNPYYAPSGDQENLYYRPADLSIKPKAAEQQDVYYSSADVVDKSKNGEVKRGNNYIDTKPGTQTPLEYSYARTDSSDAATAKVQPNSHYKALDEARCEPGMYQSLNDPITKRPQSDPSHQEQINPYYQPAGENPPPKHPVCLENSSQEKYLSLKNNAGSRENVGSEYQLPDIGNNESHYQGLTLQNQQTDPPVEYTPLGSGVEDEYEDMSGNTPDEYMHAVSTSEQRI